MTMHHAVEILLARMESHPEEFVQGSRGQWLHQIDRNKKFFNEEERDAVTAKLRQINLDNMSGELMQEMTKQEEVKPTTLIAPQSMHQILQPQLDKMFQEAYEGWEPVTEEYKWVNLPEKD